MRRRASESAFEAAANRTPAEVAVHERRLELAAQSPTVAAACDELMAQVESIRTFARIRGGGFRGYTDTIRRLCAQIDEQDEQAALNAIDRLKPITAEVRKLDKAAW